MADRRNKSSELEAADEYGTLAPARPVAAHMDETVAPGAGPKTPKPTTTLPPAPATDPSPASDTRKEDIYATLAREIPTGQTAASVPAAGPGVTGLPFDRVGDYDILDKIGHGGMGLVLKARQRGLKRIVALKMIKLGQLAEEQEVARFLIEARAAAHLKHPNIVGVYDVGEHAGSPFFSMEYVEGQSLHKLISERPLEPRRAAIILRKLAIAVDYAHESGILHRDLKPHNILLDKYEEPKITDFGLATSAQENSQLTATGTVLGTPSYMPPEQARGKHDEMGEWSDVYSLGATLYEMLVGRPPFAAATLGETLQQVMNVEPVSLRRLNPAIPRDLETICLKCLQKPPPRRYQTAGELADELQRFLEDRPILSRPTSRWEYFRRWCRRNPVVAGSIAAVFVALVVAVMGLWVGIKRATAAKNEAEATAEDAMDMVNDLLFRISNDTLLNQPGMQEVRADILTKAESSYAKLLSKLEKNQLLPQRIAVVQFKMGVIKHYLDSPVEALALYEKASDSLQSLYARDPNNARLLKDLSDVKTQTAKLHYEQKRFDASEIPMREALEIRHKLVELDPEDLEAGQLLANSEMNMGLLQEDLGQPQRALVQYEAAQKRRKELLVKEPANIGLLRDQAKGLSALGLFHARQRKLREAAEFYEQAEKAFSGLTEHKDRELDDLLNLGIVLRRLGDIAALRNGDKDLQRAIEKYIKSVQVLEELVAANSTVRIYRGTLAAARLNLAVLYERQKNPREAFFLLMSAFDEFNKLKVEDPSYKRHEMQSFHEMMRLKKWSKLSLEQQQDFAYWLEFAITANGQPWVQAIEALAASAPEYPQALRLEETELFMPGISFKR